MKPEFLAKLGAFEDAADELVRAWDYAVVHTAYPFPDSFDEVAAKISTWRQSCESKTDQVEDQHG